MELRVDEREWVQFQWPYLMAFLGGEERVSEVAYATGAFARRREIRSPGEMLQLLLTWAVAERSLQETAALAAEAGMADVSDVALPVMSHRVLMNEKALAQGRDSRGVIEAVMAEVEGRAVPRVSRWTRAVLK